MQITSIQLHGESTKEREGGSDIHDESLNRPCDGYRHCSIELGNRVILLRRADIQRKEKTGNRQPGNIQVGGWRVQLAI
jgi:hypothetical protein